MRKPMSEETKLKISISKKGSIAWNKGTKGKTTSWLTMELRCVKNAMIKQKNTKRNMNYFSLNWAINLGR